MRALLLLIASCAAADPQVQPRTDPPVVCLPVTAPGDTEPSGHTGVIEGVVVDGSGEAVPGATILATAPEQQAQSAISDERGAFRIEQLLARDYQLTIYYLDASTTHPCVHVASDAPTRVHVSVGTRGAR